MAISQKNKLKAKLIYNPNAGKKRKILFPKGTSLEEISSLLDQYQITVDRFPTKGPGHATKLAKEAITEGYGMVIVAGGDGTVGEVANGLVNSDMPLAILPLGSVMNVARMLSIPLDLEKAVELIKINRTRKIDVGCVTRLSGEKLSEPCYFIESCGLGLEAQMHQAVLEWERGDKKSLFRLIKVFFEYYRHRATITLDGKEKIETRAPLVNISNGPYSGVAIPLAPEAKLNDHHLTVTIFRMSKLELFLYILKTMRVGKLKSSKISSYAAKKVTVTTRTPRLVHADARIYGQTPVSFSIVPSALTVVTGFPQPGNSSLLPRTLLDP